MSNIWFLTLGWVLGPGFLNNKKLIIILNIFKNIIIDRGIRMEQEIKKLQYLRLF
jgi:hypothetical protein